jgi:hypothetical protein
MLIRWMRVFWTPAFAGVTKRPFKRLLIVHDEADRHGKS